MNIVVWLQNHLLTCPFKALTGIDCPGCGFQRSVIELMQGNLSKSLYYYPATIPLIFTTLFFIADMRLNFTKKESLKRGLLVFTALIITGSYVLKMTGHRFMLQF
ncbi:DUF2752 domain-containing protein [Mucilaginibacter sp.]